MDWFSSVRAKAQEAVSTVVNSETAERARQLAQQASQQAAALAKEATAKAQEVAKEAIGEAEKSLQNLRQGKKADDTNPVQYGITPELEQFVRSLTYSTFSDWPLDTLDIPHDPAEQRLNSWQEKHARLILQQVPGLQDLRFVLCPKRMDEYTFWMIYFTLCKRYLPSQEEQLQQPQSAATSAAVAANGISSAQKAAVSGLPLSSSAKNLRRSTEDGIEERVRQPQVQPDDSSAAQHTSSQSAIDAGGAGATSAPDTGTETDDGLADLADDPDLDAYLQV
eukprot:GHUV01027909.1.p1 GENE.GHUV01027909.1~~GHUV01027909.1.p1  ORF type:complete len:280 (+),score=97.07 GHUV01027909.1:355-1194(+)